MNSKYSNDEQYLQFHIGGGSRRHFSMGSRTLSVDSLLTGRDKEFNSSSESLKYPTPDFCSSAGLRSEKSPNRNNLFGQERTHRKQGYTKCSLMDKSLSSGQLEDNHRNCKEEQFQQTYTGHAGSRTKEKTLRKYKKQADGLTGMMDDVLLGRSLSGLSDDYKRVKHKQAYSGHAGTINYCSDDKSTRPHLKSPFKNQVVMDAMLYGRDLSGSEQEEPDVAFMRTFNGHAGFKAGDSPERPGKKHVTARRSVAGELIFPTEHDSPKNNRPHSLSFDGSVGHVPGTEESSGTLMARCHSADSISASSSVLTKDILQEEFVQRQRCGKLCESSPDELSSNICAPKTAVPTVPFAFAPPKRLRVNPFCSNTKGRPHFLEVEPRTRGRAYSIRNDQEKQRWR